MKSEASEPKPARRPSPWHRPIWWLNLLAIGTLLLSYLCARVSPAAVWPLALVGIAYPWLLLANAVFIAYWLIFRKRRIWPSLLCILLGWGHVGDHMQLFGTRHDAADSAAFKVMSYNVRLFDLYNWTSNVHTRDEIFDLLRMEDADVLCMQEFFNGDAGSYFATRDTLLNAFRWTDMYDRYTQHTRHGHHFGIATVSTFPIINKGSIEFPDDLNNLCIWTDLLVLGDTIRVYNAHLASIRFGDEDYAFIHQLDAGMAGDSLASGGRRIIGRLRSAFIRRAQEVEHITGHMQACPHPIVFCGDLNDTPMSYSYGMLRGDLKDAFVESGRGLGNTYIGDLPSFRIDHLLHSPSLRSSGFMTLPDELSDHRPITCWIDVVK